MSRRRRLEWAEAGRSYFKQLTVQSYAGLVVSYQGGLAKRGTSSVPRQLREQINLLASHGTPVVIVADVSASFLKSLREWVHTDAAPQVVVADTDGSLHVLATRNDTQRKLGEHVGHISAETLRRAMSAAGFLGPETDGLLTIVDADVHPELAHGADTLVVGDPPAGPRTGWFASCAPDDGPAATMDYLSKITAAKGVIKFGSNSFRVEEKSAISCLITNQERTTAILQRKDDAYQIASFRDTLGCFGGGLEAGEDPDSGILREITEEIIDPELRAAITASVQPVTQIVTSFGHCVYCYIAELADFDIHTARISQLPQSRICAEGKIEVHTIPGLDHARFSWDNDLIIWTCLEHLTGWDRELA